MAVRRALAPGVLQPSDLPRSDLAPSDPSSVAAVTVGGRVRWVRAPDGSRAVHLFDALGSVPTDLTDDAIAEGALLVVTGRLGSDAGRAALRDCRVDATYAPAGAGSDVARFLDRGVGRGLAARARGASIVRAYFEAEGFLEVTTPVLVPSPGLDLHLGAFEVPTPAGPRFLSTSPEYQMKRLLVGGVPRCFQLAPCFRRDESGRHHNAEFTMLEWYRAFASVEAVIADTEAIIAAVVGGLASGRAPALDVSRPFTRLPVAQAFADFAAIDEPAMLRMAHDDPTEFFRVLVERVEPAIEALGRPIVLHRYPAPMASLARLTADDPRYAERFEVYARGVELCNGFGELTDPHEQRARFERDQRDRAAAGLPVYPIDERFIGALAEGMPPSAGNALGLDRLVMLAADAPSIDEVMAFPGPELT